VLGAWPIDDPIVGGLVRSKFDLHEVVH